MATKTKGHWPAGKRRNAILTDRQMSGLTRRVEAAIKRRGETRTAVARHCGVDLRTVNRWLAGEDWPSAVRLAKLQLWLDSAQG
jgi:transcriptional regulator with XRE-family HTH domain